MKAADNTSALTVVYIWLAFAFGMFALTEEWVMIPAILFIPGVCILAMKLVQWLHLTEE